MSVPAITESLRLKLLAGANAADTQIDWPGESCAGLAEAGVFKWSIPAEYGGSGLGVQDQLRGSEAIAASCLTSSFILSQREAAIRRILAGPAHLRERYLPEAAAGRLFLTIGVSQLSTSRQHMGPSLRATGKAEGLRLDGDIPWITGADQAGVIVAGATLPDDRQILFALPVPRNGVTISPPLMLAALIGSRTAAIRCENVEIASEDLLWGPTEQILGKIGGGGLETSCLALGLAVAATEYLQQESKTRPELETVAGQFSQSVESARRRLHALADGSPDPESVAALRVDCTRLALQASQTGLLFAKGTGFVVPHPAQRLARQALFFLIWSCPRPVAAGVLDGLLPAPSI
ncbi:acyl-CoA dehydrogenase family protein [Zavarzinella formosa]|uniref:acyl-CoA dehydrogenase family protein n=1 Tax=Zavarzinella formosa TaxID=360055 RepID=UPI000310FB76|nr:acyl-CoA dehydrogenase family protein [Zavarzinella formosa]